MLHTHRAHKRTQAHIRTQVRTHKLMAAHKDDLNDWFTQSYTHKDTQDQTHKAVGTRHA